MYLLASAIVPHFVSDPRLGSVLDVGLIFSYFFSRVLYKLTKKAPKADEIAVYCQKQDSRFSVYLISQLNQLLHTYVLHTYVF